jgi:nucleotide-binding universal stress UspA family protein
MARAERILVPLDGSTLAEVALPKALALARLPSSEVILLHVIPPIEDAIDDGDRISIDEQCDNEKCRALRYLRSISHRPEWHGVTMQIAVDIGPAADAILEYAQKHDIDWIVMATHGRSGIRRWVIGSVAEKVLRAAPTTVVLVRAGSAAESEAKIVGSPCP